MEDSGDVVDLREELWLVRRRLDRLVSDRLNHSLSADEEAAYRDLAHREVELIWEIAVLDLSDHGAERSPEHSERGHRSYGPGSSSTWDQYFDLL